MFSSLGLALYHLRFSCLLSTDVWKKIIAAKPMCGQMMPFLVLKILYQGCIVKSDLELESMRFIVRFHFFFFFFFRLVSEPVTPTGCQVENLRVVQVFCCCCCYCFSKLYRGVLWLEVPNFFFTSCMRLVLTD